MEFFLVVLFLSIPSFGLLCYLDFQEDDIAFRIAGRSILLFWLVGIFLRCLM